MKLDFRFLLPLFYFLCFASPIAAQPIKSELDDFNKRAVRADSCLNVLENSYLVVRLPTFSKKIKHLEKLEQNKKLSSKKQNRIRKQKELQIQERDFLKRKIIEAMYQQYDFSAFLITNDTLYKEFLKGKRKGVFYNKKATIDPDLGFEGEQYLLLHYGHLDSQKTNNRSGLIVADQEHQDLEDPFPYFSRVFDNKKIMDAIFNPNALTYRDFHVVIFKLNKKLKKTKQRFQWQASSNKG